LSIKEPLSNLEISALRDDQLRDMLAQILETQREDMRENQLLYYQPVSGTAERVHLSQTRYLGIGGGNGASKTDTALAELSMHATGLHSADKTKSPSSTSMQDGLYA